MSIQNQNPHFVILSRKAGTDGKWLVAVRSFNTKGEAEEHISVLCKREDYDEFDLKVGLEEPEVTARRNRLG